MSKRTLCFLGIFLFSAILIFAQIDKNKVFILCNSTEPDSVWLAENYAELRNIPKTNIVSLEMPKSEEISWEQYNQIYPKLVNSLEKAGALRAQMVGCKPVLVSHDIDFLVSCMGVPLKVKESAPAKQLDTDKAAFDSLLSAMFLPPYKKIVKNPLFGKQDKALHKTAQIVRTARLCGGDYQKALQSVKNAIYAEEHGLMGRAYVDDSKFIIKKGGYLKKVQDILTDLGFDISLSPETPLFGFADRFDAVALYFGWYSEGPCGYFVLNEFNMPKGAIAMHLFSFSAKTQKSGWAATLINKNAACTVGNVYEPYLGLTHRFDMYLAALCSGFSAGEAAYFSSPSLRWQNIFIGDPLYMPFKRKLSEQLKDIENGNAAFYSQYAVIRAMNLVVKKSGNTLNAVKLGIAYAKKLKDNTALLFKIAQLLQTLGDNKNALLFAENTAKTLADPNNPYFGLNFEVAKFASGLGNNKLALELCKQHISAHKNGKTYLKNALPIAIEYAKNIDNALLQEYTQTLKNLNTPKN